MKYNDKVPITVTITKIQKQDKRRFLNKILTSDRTLRGQTWNNRLLLIVQDTVDSVKRSKLSLPPESTFICNCVAKTLIRVYFSCKLSRFSNTFIQFSGKYILIFESHKYQVPFHIRMYFRNINNSIRIKTCLILINFTLDFSILDDLTR